jgi:4-alpha-glucanotransferase
MKYDRSSGILLHPTSLPGPDGIGDLGPHALRWLDFLERSGSGLWQVLPLNPTGYGDSPYQSFSAFAGNIYLISPTVLLNEGLLAKNDFDDRPIFPIDQVDFGSAIQWKLALLSRAFEHYKAGNNQKLTIDFESFQIENSIWLSDFALFMAIKETQGGVSWNHWPNDLRKRSRQAITHFSETYSDLILQHIFWQFLFFRQWRTVSDYAHHKGIKIIGDAPIFVAYDSADVWSNPELFYLNEEGLPTVVAGVPPDYFSPTGQLWGNPLYNWNVHKETGYAWWTNRLKNVLKIVDIVRLDHFRGFAGYWEIPFGMPTAEIGKWVSGPGPDLFSTLKKGLGDLPIIAEDLGVVTPDVVTLRDGFNLPGMKILQFAFSSTPDDPFLPHNYPTHCVAYTGTHDNDTSLGWYKSAPIKELDFCRHYLPNSNDQEIPWNMIRGIWRSNAIITLAPMQDFLDLDSIARMNYPGRLGGNWTWRMQSNALSDSLQKRIFEMNYLYSRLPKASNKPKVI